MKMQGHTILVAGGTRGIGRGVAELLCRLGNEVLVFGGDPAAAGAVARTQPGMRAVDLDLSDPWAVTGFTEQVAAVCPGLNMLVNVSIAFPVKYLPGLGALDEEAHEAREAHRLGVQHLAGALMPHFRKRAHSAVMNVAVGPAFAPPPSPLAGLAARPAAEGGAHGCALSVRTRWVSAVVEAVDVALPSWVERASLEQASPGMSRVEFIASLANLLAENLHEEAALARLRALGPAPRPVARATRDDGLVSPVA